MEQVQKKKPGPKPISALERSFEDGIKCWYARFQAPVSPGINMEPVYEFYVRHPAENIMPHSPKNKYTVDAMSHNEHTMYWKLGGLIQETPWVNVQWARPIVSYN